MERRYSSLKRYIEEYENILSENIVKSFVFKFLLKGKESYFYKLYNIIVSGESIDPVNFYDIVLNLLYSKNAPCGVFINESISLIIEKHNKNNPGI